MNRLLPLSILATYMMLLHNSVAQPVLLDDYVRQGLQRNLALAQQSVLIEKAQLSLKEARALFYPTVVFGSDYTVARGGRTINLPLGDLMNPIYQSLNQLNGSDRFRSIPNQTVQFLPNDFHDTRLMASVPILNTRLRYEQPLRSETITQLQASRMVYKRQLVNQIKQAYYQVMNSYQRQAVYANAEKRLTETLRMTQGFFSNGKVLKSDVLRVQTDLTTNKAQQRDAQNQLAVAQARLNVLLNAPLTTPIPFDCTLYERVVVSEPVIDDTGRREELEEIASLSRQAAWAGRMAKAATLPTLSANVSTGFQGFGYTFASNQGYVMGTMGLRWTLFQGRQNSYRQQQAQADLTALQTKLIETQQQIDVEVLSADRALNTAQAMADSRRSNLNAAKEYHRITKSRYGQGRALLVELTDAFTQLLDNELACQQALSDVLAKQAALELATASYSF